MGGQACVFYGAAEFSRDLDLLILADADNLDRLRAALDDLDARPIAVPPLDAGLLARGHAVHFRCRRPDVPGLRIDVMAVLRGVAGFDELWERRTTIELEGEPIDLMGIEDLVRAKKTQRDKDWPMIRRLVEQNYFTAADRVTPESLVFWLRELRTPELLLQLASANPEIARRSERPAVAAALTGNTEAIETALAAEERDECRRTANTGRPSNANSKPSGSAVNALSPVER
jgi:hypothetical protein